MMLMCIYVSIFYRIWHTKYNEAVINLTTKRNENRNKMLGIPKNKLQNFFIHNRNTKDIL